MTLTRITFERKDGVYPRLESAAEKIAEFLYAYKSRIQEFCDLMRISSNWSKSNYKNELAKWASMTKGRRKKNVAPDTEQLVVSAYLFFDTCQDNQEIRKMRGLVPEKLVEKIFLLRYQGKTRNQGFGALVTLDKEDIKYICEAPYDKGPEDSDKNRQTVDAGAWDGKKGEFIEVKFNPEAFHTKDIRYLRLLASELKNKELNHSIYLIAMDDKNLTEQRLKHLDLWESGEFILVGREEIFELQTG